MPGPGAVKSTADSAGETHSSTAVSPPTAARTPSGIAADDTKALIQTRRPTW